MTLTRRFFTALSVAAFILSAVPAALAQTAALKAVTSDAGGVRVVVKPKAIGSGAFWEFEVTMDTHTKPLNDDMVKTSVLVDGTQARYAAVAWQGDPAGGHHRKGVLRFPAPASNAKSFDVEIADVAGTGRRVFQWKVN